MAEQSELLIYLTASGVEELTPQTALIGHDGWADARLGDFYRSDVFLNDYVAIKELRKWEGDFGLDKPALEEALSRCFRTTMEGGLGTTPEPPYLRSCQPQQWLRRGKS